MTISLARGEDQGVIICLSMILTPIHRARPSLRKWIWKPEKTKRASRRQVPLPGSGGETVRPSVVVLASRFDLTCDYVVAELRRSCVSYLRINTEDLPHLDVLLNPIVQRLTISSEVGVFELTQSDLTAIYFRRPVYLREYTTESRPAHEQLVRTHWASFIRSFMIFNRCRWMNYPGATYVAEHKALQLAAAVQLGFDVPDTLVTNSMLGIEAVRSDSPLVAIKGLDTVLLRENGKETFGYTSLLEFSEITSYNVRAAPVVVQEALCNKLDLRVTVVGDSYWCASATLNGQGIEGDWRICGRSVIFAEYILPEDVAQRCIALTKHFGLLFSAIDLALHKDHYYFLEINPTGEWAWLHVSLGFPIPRAIVSALTSKIGGQENIEPSLSQNP